MRKLSFVVAAGAAIACTAPGLAQARGIIHPNHYAYSQLHYGIAWEAYDAGCLKWNFRTQAWYTRCGLPQFPHVGPHVLRAKW